MKFNKLAIIFAAFMFLFANALQAADTEDGGRLSQYQDELDDKDWDALRQYLRHRRDVEKDQSESALLISGDVRGDWKHKIETLDNLSLTGGDAVDLRGIRRGRDSFKIQANVRLDYDLDDSWMVLQLQYDNKAGIDDEVNCVDRNPEGKEACYCNELQGSGTCGDICLKQAFFGYNLYKCGDTEFDIEIGRRNLYHVFDSKVQFLSRFDGILLSLDSTWKDVMDYYARVAGFVVDYKANHYAWVMEIGALEIYDTGLELKYSFIDWNKNGRNRCTVGVKGCENNADCCDNCKECNKVDKDNHKPNLCCGKHHPLGSRFQISQFTGAYDFKKDITCINQRMRIFGAFLYNHDTPDPCYTSQNKAWYAGFRIGEVKKANDWAWQMMYQYVQAFSVPDLDMAGIGNGNTNDGLILTDRIGNTNFKGWRFDGMYAFTDDITINARCEWSTQITEKLGGSHYFNLVKVEMIYAF